MHICVRNKNSRLTGDNSSKPRTPPGWPCPWLEPRVSSPSVRESVRKRAKARESVTFGFCPWESAQSVKRSCKAKRDFFLLNPPIKGDIVFLLFGMAVGEPPRQDPGALKEQATQLRGLCASYRRGGLIVSRYAAWSRSWQLLASTLSSCWLVK